MLTTDGKELKENRLYYTRHGEQAILSDWGNGNNKMIFIIAMLYEGEAVGAELLPSGHSEFHVPYEHYGEFTIVHELFSEPPLFIVDKEYKEKKKEILTLCNSIGILQESIKNLKEVFKIGTEEHNELCDKLNIIKAEIAQHDENLEKKKDELSGLKLKISNAEDRLSDLKTPDDIASIGKEELGELRKDQFMLSCLQAGGVDNWNNYDDSLDDFRSRYP